MTKLTLPLILNTVLKNNVDGGGGGCGSGGAIGMCVRSGWWSFKIHDNFMCKFKTKKVGFRKSWVGWEREGGPSPLLITLLLRACITEKLSSIPFLRTQPPYGGFIFNRYAKNFSSVSLFHTCTRTPSLWFIFTYALKPFLPDM